MGVQAEKERRSEENLGVCQANRLTAAHYDFSAIQQDIIYRILARIQQYVKYPDRMQKRLWTEVTVEIPLKEIDDNKNYQRVIEEAEKLRTKHIRFEWLMPNGKTEFISIPPLTVIKHIYRSKVVRLTIPKEMVSALVYLGGGFTRYHLNIALSLKSKFSKRMYEICCQWQKKGGVKISLEEFHNMLQLSNSYRPVKELKKRVLHPAQHELQEKADVGFDYSLSTRKKTGGKGRPAADTLHLRISKKENGHSVHVSKEKVTSELMDEFLFNFFHLWIPGVMSARHICDVLRINSNLEKAYTRFFKLQEEFSAGSKDKKDVRALTRYILKEDFGFKIPLSKARVAKQLQVKKHLPIS